MALFANELAHRVDPAAVGYRSAGRGRELGNPNLGHYSPVELQHLDDFHVGGLIMHRTDFEGKRRVLTRISARGPFLPATDVRLMYQTYELSLQRGSAGRSLFVLPVQFNHCWTIKGTGPQAVRS
jgi:hypothetical protein